VATNAFFRTLALLALVAGCGGDDGSSDVVQGALDTPPAPVTAASSPVDSAAAMVPDSAPAAAVEADASDASAAVNGPEDALGSDPEMAREMFSYTGGSRDPFLSLLAGAQVGPELPDLNLVAIYYDTRSPSNSTIVMREKVSAKRYTLKEGDRIGRIRVASIRPKDVTFSIDDFGTVRQETLTLRKQEDTP